MGKFEKVDSKAIKESLEQTHRQYLSGKLKLPQIIKEIVDENIEVGISSYKKSSTELPHYHTEVSEYQYMLRGMTEYMDTETGEVHRYVQGDFYVIRPGTKYAQRIKQNTDILFFKYPGKNDKVNLDLDEKVKAWLDEPLRVKRLDFNDAEEPPTANTIIPAVSVAIINDQKQVLMLKRRDSGNWTIPGGTMEFGEDLASCGIREVKEETGLDVSIVELIGTYTNPKNIVAYDDGEVRQEFTLMYAGQMTGTDVSIDDESTEFRWVREDEALQLPLAKSQRTRIQDLAEYLKTGEKFYR